MKYELDNPTKNFFTYGKYYVAVKNSTLLYLRKSGEVKESTGCDDEEVEDSGYWDTYEEAMEAKTKYEQKDEDEMQFPVKKRWFYSNEVVIFDGYYNGRKENGATFISTVPVTHPMWKDVPEEQYLIASGTYVNDLANVCPDNAMLGKHDDDMDSLKYKECETGNEKYDENEFFIEGKEQKVEYRGDGGKTSYYELPEGAKELGDLIYHKDMNHSVGEAFCALYRLHDNGEYERNLRKAKYYIDLELSRLES